MPRDDLPIPATPDKESSETAPITVYDSRETLVLGDPKPQSAETVARLFDSEAPLAYDGKNVYLAIRLADGPSRSQTCYAVVSAELLESVTDLIPIVAETVEQTSVRFEPATPTQLAYVCEAIRSYKPSDIPWIIPEILGERTPLRCGVPQYKDAIVVLEAALETGTPLAVSRREIYLTDDSREAIVVAENIVVVDDRFDDIQFSTETQKTADRLQRERHNRRVDKAIESVTEAIADLRELGLADSEIRETISKELPGESITTRKHRPSSVIGRLHPTASSPSDDPDASGESQPSRLTGKQWGALVSIGLVILTTIIVVALWQFGTVPSDLSLPSVTTVPFDASVVLLIGAAVALSGFAVALLAQ